VIVDEDAAARRLAAPSRRACCARARLRGAFLATGTVARPDAAAHLEILCRDSDAAALLASSLEDLGIPGLVLSRRGRALVAARTVESVAAALSSMGAQHGRLRFEEGRVLREVRASVNRRLNAETANLRRTVTAGVRQLAAITALEADPNRFELLPAALREAAALRLRHPQDTLEMLAERAGCSRSAMADRLRRLLVEAAPGGSLAAGIG
jgi:DNA-binding protein WhiA